MSEIENELPNHQQRIPWERLQSICLGRDIKLLISYKNHILQNQVAKSYLAKNTSILWDKNLCDTFGINIHWLINSKNKSVNAEYLKIELINNIVDTNENLVLYCLDEKFVLCDKTGLIIHYGFLKGEYISVGSSLLNNEKIRLIDKSTVKREYFFKTYRPGNDDWEFEFSGTYIIRPDMALLEVDKNFNAITI